MSASQARRPAARRILYLNPDAGIPVLGEKGASVHVRAMVNALSALGHEVGLCYTRAGSGNLPPPCRMMPLEAGIGEKARPSAHTAPPPGLAAKTSLARERDRIALDAVLADRVERAMQTAGFAAPDLLYERHALFHAGGIAVAERFGIPRILEVNAPIVEEQARHRGLILRDEAEAAERRSFLGADLVVAVSDAVAAHVASQGTNPARILVAPNGADTARFHPESNDGKMVRGRYSLRDLPVVGFVGSFKSWHGFDFLLDAFARVAATLPEARLLAVGTGPMLEAARGRAAEPALAGRVIFTGDIPHHEVPAHLAAMDITVAPYLDQPGFYFSPLKVVESLAAGRPVVAPRLGQIERLIRDGETGRLYPPGDLGSCAREIAALLRHPELRARMGERGAREAQAAWDWTQVASRILDHVPSTRMARAP